jgi:hypothetical protein
MLYVLAVMADGILVPTIFIGYFDGCSKLPCEDNRVISRFQRYEIAFKISVVIGPVV